MKYKPKIGTYWASDDERGALNLEDPMVYVDEAFDVLTNAIRTREHFVKGLALAKISKYPGARTPERLAMIKNRINVVEGVIEFLGDQISIDAAIQEMEDHANGTNL